MESPLPDPPASPPTGDYMAPVKYVARVAKPEDLRPGDPAPPDAFGDLVPGDELVPTAAQLVVPRQLMFNEAGRRSLLAYHGIGTGKTRVGVLAVVEFLRAKRALPDGAIPPKPRPGDLRSAGAKRAFHESLAAYPYRVEVWSPFTAIKRQWVAALKAFSRRHPDLLPPSVFVKFNARGEQIVQVRTFGRIQGEGRQAKARGERAATFFEEWRDGSVPDMKTWVRRDSPIQKKFENRLFVIDEIHRGFIVPEKRKRAKKGSAAAAAAAKKGAKQECKSFADLNGRDAAVRRPAYEDEPAAKQMRRLHRGGSIPHLLVEARDLIAQADGGKTDRCPYVLALTATPTYDKAELANDIVDFLRLVSGEAPAFLTPPGAACPAYDLGALRDAARGYVSYVRGEDPRSFPVRLAPTRPGAGGAPVAGSARYPSRAWEDEGEEFNEFVRTRISPKQAGLIGRIKEKQPMYFKTSAILTRNLEYTATGDEVLDVGDVSPVFEAVAEQVLARADSGIALVTFEFQASAAHFGKWLEEAHGFARFGSGAGGRRGRAYISNIQAAWEPEGGGRWRLRRKGIQQSGLSDADMKAVRSKRNRDGSVVRVIIATSAILTGVSFLNVRQIHVVESWWNIDKIKQTIGRGFRRDSHTALPPRSRNVVVFQHRYDCCEGKASGAVARKIGRVFALQEQKRAAALQTIRALQESAVDCVLQRNRTVADYVRAVQHAYPVVVDVFGVARSPRESAGGDERGLTCDAESARLLVGALPLSREPTSAVVVGVAEVMAGVFRMFWALTEAQLFEYTRLLAATATSMRHAAVQYVDDDEVMRMAARYLVDESARRHLISPTGKHALLGRAEPGGAAAPVYQCVDVRTRAPLRHEPTPLVAPQEWLSLAVRENVRGTRDERAGAERAAGVAPALPVQAQQFDDEYKKFRAKVRRAFAGGAACRLPEADVVRHAADAVFDRQPPANMLGLVSWAKTAPAGGREWQAAVAARAADLAVVSRQRRHRRRTLRRYRWDARAGALVEYHQMDLRGWRAPAAPPDARAVAYMKPSSKKEQRSAFVVDYRDGRSPKRLATIPLEEHPGWYRAAHERCFYPVGGSKRRPKRYLRHAEAVELLVRAGRFGGSGGGGAAGGAVRLVREARVPAAGPENDFGADVHDFRASAFGSLARSKLAGDAEALRAVERAALDAALDRLSPRDLRALVSWAKATPAGATGWQRFVASIGAVTAFEAAGATVDAGLRSVRYTWTGGAAAPTAGEPAEAEWRWPVGEHRAFMSYRPAPPARGAEGRERRQRLELGRWVRKGTAHFFAGGVVGGDWDTALDLDAATADGARVADAPPAFRAAHRRVFGDAETVQARAAELLIRAGRFGKFALGGPRPSGDVDFAGGEPAAPRAGKKKEAGSA